MPEEFNVDGTVYTIGDFMFTSEPVLKHGMRAFVDAMSKSLGGKVKWNILTVIKFNSLNAKPDFVLLRYTN